MLLLVASALAAPWSTDLADLDPEFRARVDRVIRALGARGYTPVVSCTWRDEDVQDALAALGGSTKASGGESCHNRRDAEGNPAARAVDIWSRPLDLALFAGLSWRLEIEVPFLRVLGALARAEGLRWGGAWHGRPSAWDAHGLGWDPAHVEMGACVGR